MSARLQSLRPSPQTPPCSEDASDPSPESVVRRKRGVSQVDPPKTDAQNSQKNTVFSESVKKPRTTKNSSGEHQKLPPEPASTSKPQTRPSNNAHPALRPGVRTKLYEPREEITARAAGKRADGEAKKEAKRVEQAEKQRKEKNGKAKIAAAMNASEREVREREEKNKQPFGGNVVAEAFNGGFDARVVRKDPTDSQNPPLTATEKKKERANKFLTDISEIRQKEKGAEVPKTQSSTSTSHPRTTTSATTQPKKTLNDDWRSNIKPLQRDNYLGAASPSVSKKVSTSKSKGKRAAKDVRVESEVKDDDSDALREKETGIDDEVLEKFDRGGAGHDEFQVDIFDVDNDTLKPKTEPKDKKEKKSNRRPKSVVPPKKSLAFDAMPEWAQDKWWALRGTICHKYGEDNRPFKLGDGRDCRFARDVEAAVHVAVPSEEDFAVASTGDRVYARLRQGIYEWRDDFFNAVAKLADQRLTALHKKLGTERMKDWVQRALSANDGAAYWDIPGTEATPARRSLRSEYIVTAFATHLKNIKHSARDPERYPIGALALSCAAVQRCFEAWLPGVPPKSYPPFSEKNVSSLVEDYATGPSIQALVDKPHRFDDLIKAAFERLDTPEPSSKSVSARNKASTHKAAVVIEPSSEPEHDEQNMEEDEESLMNNGEVDGDGDVIVNDNEDIGKERKNVGGDEIVVKAEDFGEDYVFGDNAENFGGPAGGSTLSLEVDGLEIVSLPTTRSGSLEPQDSRGLSSPSSFLSLD